jgi:hypothetical protein
MAGLDPAIHVFLTSGTKDVDARVKPGHDDVVNHASLFTAVDVRGGTYFVTGIG